MKRIHASRLMRLARFLMTLTQEQFQYSDWVEKQNGRGCGTTCCAGGWCPKVFKAHWKWTSCGDVALKKESTEIPIDDLSKFFGLTNEEASAIFIDGYTSFNGDRQVDTDKHTPQMIAGIILAFLMRKGQLRVKA